MLRSVHRGLEGIALEIAAQVGDEGKLFGSVTSQHLADLLGQQGVEVERRKIVLAEPIKTVGEHTITIRLRNDVVASLKVTVTAAS